VASVARMSEAISGSGFQAHRTRMHVAALMRATLAGAAPTSIGNISFSCEQSAMRRRTKIILVAIGVVIGWPFAQIGLIAAQAQYFANGRPYCIQVSSGRVLQYRSVVSLLEFEWIHLVRAVL